jgi:hypothetical protein
MLLFIQWKGAICYWKKKKLQIVSCKYNLMATESSTLLLSIYVLLQ